MPVYLGQLDAILNPYVRILTQEEIDSRINVSGAISTERSLMRLCTQTSGLLTALSSAPFYADELKQAAPNLTLFTILKSPRTICCLRWQKTLRMQ